MAEKAQPRKRKPPRYSMPERGVYARTLQHGMRINLVVLIATFVIYAAGLLPSRTPIEQLPKYWSMSSRDYVTATGAPTGWDWLADLGYGDNLAVLGIAGLATVSAICYLRVLPIFLRRKERLFPAIIIAEVLVIVLAASGLLAWGGH